MITRSHHISYAEAVNHLEMLGQEHLLNFWTELSHHQQHHLLQQIAALDLKQLKLQRRLLKQPISIDDTFSPFEGFAFSGNEDDASLGRRLIADGKVGCLIIAGGQGTRLRFHGAKGMFPVTPIKHKSLFQLFAERTLAAGKQAARSLKLAIMTSPQNDAETQAFFEQNQRFGLDAAQLSFFSQGELPLLDGSGNCFLDAPGNIACGPDGNGGCLGHFVRSGLWQSWNAAGIQYLNLILVDNALADPYHAELVGFHARKGVQVTVQCIERLTPQEKLGLLVAKGQKVGVIEYTEMPESERVALADGKLKHRCANMSTFCFDMDFVHDVVLKVDLPWHVAHKAMPYVDQQGMVMTPQSPNAWKYERFIFDLLPFAASVAALLCDRDICFAPLKNESGENSLETVQKALLQRDTAILEKITDKKVNVKNIELAQEFYYPTPALLARWSHHPVPDEGYIADF